jgi:hypothetical protein
MELTSWEATGYSVTQEFRNILWNQKVHYDIHKTLLLVPILKQINPIMQAETLPLRSIIILTFCLHLGLTSSWLSYQNTVCIPLSPIHATYPTDLILFYLIVIISSTSYSFMHFLTLLLITMSANTLSLWSCINVRNQTDMFSTEIMWCEMKSKL